MRKTVDALMLSIGIDSVLYGRRAREKVFYQQRHGTGTWLTSGASTNEWATQALKFLPVFDWLAPYQHTHFLEKAVSI